MSEEFLELFKKLEELSKKKYLELFHINASEMDRKPFKDVIHELGMNGVTPFSKKYNIIYYCADVRNVCSHIKKINDEYVVSPNEYLVKELKSIINEIENPIKLISIAIPIKKIYKRDIEDSIKQTIKIMNENTYTHVPIFDKGLIIGVFSENAMFNYINNEEIVAIDEHISFENMLPYLNIENQTESILFLQKDILVDDVIKKFKDNFKSNEKLACIYITDNGKQSGNLLGMITSWDILGKYFY